MTPKVGKQDGSAAANDPGSTSIGAAMSAAAAAAGPHEPVSPTLETRNCSGSIGASVAECECAWVRVWLSASVAECECG